MATNPYQAGFQARRPMPQMPQFPSIGGGQQTAAAPTSAPVATPQAPQTPQVVPQQMQAAPQTAVAPVQQPQANLGMGGGYQQNPYLNQVGQSMTNQVTQNLQRNILPGITSNAIASGNFGGSRQGVVEANALNDANRGLSDALANMYASDYNNAMNRQSQMDIASMQNQLGYAGLTNTKDIASMQNQLGYAGLRNTKDIANMQNQLGYAGLTNAKDIAGMQNATTMRGQDLSTNLGYAGLANTKDIAGMQNATTQRGQDVTYNLGMGQNQTAQRGQDLGFYTQQRGQDLQQAQLGADLYNQYVMGNLGLGQNLTNIGNTYQNAPWQTLQGFGSLLGSGTGGGTSTTTQSSNPYAGMAGGALMGAQFGSLF